MMLLTTMHARLAITVGLREHDKGAVLHGQSPRVFFEVRGVGEEGWVGIFPGVANWEVFVPGGVDVGVLDLVLLLGHDVGALDAGAVVIELEVSIDGVDADGGRG